MTAKEIKIVFEPSGRNIVIDKGATILDAAKKCGFKINIPCGGNGTCGKCRVRVRSGQTHITEQDKNVFTASELAAGWRLACKAVVTQDMIVDIPQASLVDSHHQIVTSIGVRQNIELRPAVKKVYVKLPQASLEDGRSDLTRVKDILGAADISLPLLRRLPEILRDGDFGATFTILGEKIIAIDSGDTSGKFYGIAFDIGTTTVAGKLLCLGSGKELAVVSRMNPQVSFGDDVVSRINYASLSAENLAAISGAIITAVDEMCAQLAAAAAIDAGDVAAITVAGNTTMLELFAAINPKPLGEMPFISAYGDGLWFGADCVGLKVCPAAKVFLFPVIGSFVGGDTTACIIASDILHDHRKMLMIDIGTNGEIVLRNNHKLIAASTAAGPALEGARISCGMRAASGAIERIDFDDDVKISVIGGGEPVGICGSAIIDIAACLLSSGIVSVTGQMKTADELDGSVPAAIAARVAVDENGNPEFIVVRTPERKISITQKDIRELQLASGAIRAGINILLKHASVSIDELDEIQIAGGFGFYIRQENAQRIGLLPRVSDAAKISYIGNAALAGAELALLSDEKLMQSREAAVKTKHTELSLDLDFQMEFAEAMMFPQF